MGLDFPTFFLVHIKRFLVFNERNRNKKHFRGYSWTETMTGITCIQEPDLPVEVILHILSQVYVEENEVVHVAPGEGGLQMLGS